MEQYKIKALAGAATFEFIDENQLTLCFIRRQPSRSFYLLPGALDISLIKYQTRPGRISLRAVDRSLISFDKQSNVRAGQQAKSLSRPLLVDLFLACCYK